MKPKYITQEEFEDRLNNLFKTSLVFFVGSAVMVLMVYLFIQIDLSKQDKLPTPKVVCQDVNQTEIMICIDGAICKSMQVTKQVCSEGAT